MTENVVFNNETFIEYLPFYFYVSVIYSLSILQHTIAQ